MIYQRTMHFCTGEWLMRKFEVTIIKTTTDRFIVTADDLLEAEEIAIFGDLEPYLSEDLDPIIETEEVNESP